MWLAKQVTLTSPGRLVSPLVLFKNVQGSLNVHHSSLLLRQGVDALVFYVIHQYFFFIYSANRFELNTQLRELTLCMTNDHHLTKQICNTQKQVYITFALELVLRELCFMFCFFNLCVKSALLNLPR